MRLNKLKENMEFHLHGIRHQVVSIDPPKVYVIRGKSSREEEYDYFELINDPSFQSLDVVVQKVVEEKKGQHYSPLDLLLPGQRVIVTKRSEMIKPILLLLKLKAGDLKARIEFTARFKHLILKHEKPEKISQESLIHRIAKIYNVHERTIHRRLAEYKKHETALPNQGLVALIPKTTRQNLSRKDCHLLEICHPKKKDLILDVVRVRIPSACHTIIKEVIETEFLTLKNDSAKAIFDLIEARCILQDIDPPKYDTIYKLLNRINPEVRARMREGKVGSEKFTEVERGFSNYEAKYPLHIVEIDHTEFDMDVIDEKTGYVIGRPYITLGIDVFSRKIWCMEISFEPPSADKVRRAIMHGIFFKDAKKKYDTVYDWDVYGIPTIIYMDNGPEFKNAEVKRMINETLQSQVQYRPVKTPRYGGTIERYFGTINSELIHRLHGTRKGSVKQKGDYDSEKEAVFTLEDIRELLTFYITNYHYEPHSGLPIQFPTTAARYYAGLEMVGFPEWIDKEDEDYYKMELLPVIVKPYTRDGVRFENVRYKNSSQHKLVMPREYKYKVKYDSDDVSKLFLQLPETGEYIELVVADRSVLEEIEGLNRYTYKKVMEVLREQGNLLVKQIPGAELIKKAKATLLDRIQKLVKTRRKARAQAERMALEVGINVAIPPQPSKPKTAISLSDMFDQLDE
ncbi:integrase catalytic domain-containing protein [Paenibacillus qinlingensis]|uniref:integrase catalytic domain-containing protein n=1 Tax=Paenibacillus qinlingensis TaxID=1837343 RepID=UPI001566EB6C|nr:DDE-type integrase/transposase/recombinase [Paenibacillus qinlingensis]NQX62210.1 transposase family protein [Paenibacillus qinlingensis]